MFYCDLMGGVVWFVLLCVLCACVGIAFDRCVCVLVCDLVCDVVWCVCAFLFDFDSV